MIDGLKPYPAMKDSGVPWLGDVPEHWQLQRMKNLLHERVRKGFPDEPLLAATQSRGVVRKERYENRTVVALKDLHLLKLVRVGDFVISLRSFQGGIEHAREQGIISPAYTVLYPARPEMHGYLAYLFKSIPYIENLSLYVTGIRQGQNIDYEKLARAELPLPSISEQSAIVRFLDYADRRIRRYIRAKQKLIKLLEEQKQAIIHRAVTRGLDPNVGLKRSGIEWLGDVPEHWDVRLLGRCLLRIDQGWSPIASEGELEPDQWAVLTLSSVKNGTFNKAAVKPVPMNATIPGGIEICDGDLLLTRSNTRELVGDVCIVRGPRPRTLICDLIYRLVPDWKVLNSNFLMYQLLSRAGRDQIERDARGSSGTMPKIAQRHIRSWIVLAPPLREQSSISEAIENDVSRLRRAIDLSAREIALLREYRTRLIADVVTGKLDAREAATGLPDDIEEPELLEGADAESDAEEADVADTNNVPEEAEA